jgi:hypothetical protein
LVLFAQALALGDARSEFAGQMVAQPGTNLLAKGAFVRCEINVHPSTPKKPNAQALIRMQQKNL